MTVKSFQVQDGIKLSAGATIVDFRDQPLFQTTESRTQLSAGIDSNSPYWTNTVGGATLPQATVLSVSSANAAPPVITLSSITLIPDSTKVQIQGATGLTNINNNWYLKNTAVDQYELYTDSDLSTFEDMSEAGSYDDNSASLSYWANFGVYNAVYYDSEGNVLAAGIVGTYLVNQVVVGKYSPTGANIWLKTLSDPAYDLGGWGLSVDASNNILLAVNNNSKVLVVKLSGEDGSIIWQTGITSPTGEYGYALELAADGNPVIAGTIVNAEDSSNDFLVAKVSAEDGTLIWSKRIGASFYQEAYSVACDSHGHIAVVGYTERQAEPDMLMMVILDDNGSLLNNFAIQGPSNVHYIVGVDTAIDSQDNLYISATGELPSYGGTAAFLIKANFDGDIAWTRMIGPGPCVTSSSSLALDGDDRIYMFAVNGQETTDVPQFDMVFGCYDPDGNPLFQRRWGSPQFWEVAGFEFEPGQMISVYGDYIAVAGWTLPLPIPGGSPVGDPSAMVAQLPKNGDLITIGSRALRPSNFRGQFFTLDSVSQEIEVTSNVLNQSDSNMTVLSGTLVSTSTSDSPSDVHNWRFNADGSMDAAGAVNVTAVPWDQDIWVGDEVLFVKTNYGDESDAIDTDMTITRGNADGIFNIALEEEYQQSTSPEGTEWNGEGWADLSNVTSRDYQTWRDAVYPPNSQVGREFVMHDTINDKYYTVKFTSWQANANGGGFGYVRRQINTSAYFYKEPNGDQMDHIDVGLTLARDSNNILYNPAAGETDADTDYSPLNTVWNGDGWDNLSNLDTRQWLNFYAAMGDANVGKRVLGREWIMWDFNNNQYYAIKFTLWQPGNNGGAFKYIRRRINRAAVTHGIKFSDGSVQREAWDKSAAGILPQVKYTESDDRWLNIDDVGKHIYFTQSGVEIYLPDIGDQPWRLGSTITIVNRSGGNIYLYKDNDNENGNIYGAGTANDSTAWIIPDSGGGNICSLMLTEISGYDDVTANWILSGPGIETN